jgi:hypothetical protein
MYWAKQQDYLPWANRTVDMDRLYDDRKGFEHGTANNFCDMDIDRLMLQGKPSLVFEYLGNSMMTLGNGGIFRQEIGNGGIFRQEIKFMKEGIVIRHSHHYILMPMIYKDAIGKKVSKHFGVKGEVHVFDCVMWKGDKWTIAGQDLLGIMEQVRIPVVALITFAMKAKVMIACK